MEDHLRPEPATNNWIHRAACAEPDRDPEIWFPEGSSAKAKGNGREAKRICFDECPVRLKCLKHACRVRAAVGIFGGVDDTKRNDHDFDYDSLKRVGRK
ncbi:WhiB family transcriptional regulator [Streptomyces phaeochromogenes]